MTEDIRDRLEVVFLGHYVLSSETRLKVLLSQGCTTVTIPQ